MTSLPYEVLWVPGHEAVKRLHELRLQPGVTPVMLGDEDAVERVVEGFELASDRSVESLVADAQRISAADWFRNRKNSDSDFYNADLGEWSGAEPNDRLRAHEDILTRKPHPEVAIALIPTSQSWQVPCFLRAGGWNDLPTPAEHAAIFKYWGERYGATVAAMADDVIEFTVERPPMTPDDALALAHEQFLYAPDIVHQGVGTLQDLAAVLCGAHAWWFWWD
jgi:hypothetical protein